MEVSIGTLARFLHSLLCRFIEQTTATTWLTVLYFSSDECIKYSTSIYSPSLNSVLLFVLSQCLTNKDDFPEVLFPFLTASAGIGSGQA